MLDASLGILPQHCILPIAAHATNLSRLVPDLYVQALQAVVMMVEMVMMLVVLGTLDMPFHCIPLSFSCAKVQRGPTTHPESLMLRLSALTPRTDFKAVLILALSNRAR